jgi:hypothetical protein
MKTEQTTKTETKTAYGKELDTPIAYEFTVDLFDTFAELQAAKAELTGAEQVKARNAKIVAAARSAAMNAALAAAGYEKPTAENDEQTRLKDMFKVLMTSKRYTEEQARDLAASTLGLTWED